MIIPLGIALFLGLMAAVFFMKKDDLISLGFVPVAGEKSNYMDCTARDTNGKVWQSRSGVWYE